MLNVQLFGVGANFFIGNVEHCREQGQVDLDEVLEKQNNVINGGNSTPVFILSSQPYSLGVLSYSWCTALSTLLLKDMRPWTSTGFFLFSTITKLVVLV